MQCGLSDRSKRNLQVRGSSSGSRRTRNDTAYHVDPTGSAFPFENCAWKTG